MILALFVEQLKLLFFIEVIILAYSLEFLGRFLISIFYFGYIKYSFYKRGDVITWQKLRFPQTK